MVTKVKMDILSLKSLRIQYFLIYFVTYLLPFLFNQDLSVQHTRRVHNYSGSRSNQQFKFLMVNYILLIYNTMPRITSYEILNIDTNE